jgi:hypothetical protein
MDETTAPGTPIDFNNEDIELIRRQFTVTNDRFLFLYINIILYIAPLEERYSTKKEKSELMVYHFASGPLQLLSRASLRRFTCTRYINSGASLRSFTYIRYIVSNVLHHKPCIRYSTLYAFLRHEFLLVCRRSVHVYFYTVSPRMSTYSYSTTRIFFVTFLYVCTSIVHPPVVIFSRQLPVVTHSVGNSILFRLDA